MAITWGGYATGTSGRQFRIGYEFVTTAENSISVTVRLDMYLNVRYGVSDSSNSFVVDGGVWGRAGAVSAVCSYNSTVLLWQQAQAFSKVYGSTQAKSFSSSLNGLDVFGMGTTASVSGTYTVAARSASAPSTPSAPSVSSILQNSATVNMVLPSNNGAAISATTCKLYTASTGGSVAATVNNASSATTFNFSSLSASTTYWAAVSATNAAGTSGESARTSFTTAAATAPDAPASPTASAITQMTATITGVAPNANGGTITGYQWQVATDAAFSNLIMDASITALVVNLTSLTAYSQYFVRFRANSYAGYSSWSPTLAFYTAATVPAAPDMPSRGIKRFDGGTFVITPATPRGTPVTGHTLQIATDIGFTSIVSSTTGTSLVRTITSLAPGVQHYMRVNAQSALGDSPWSLGVVFRTETGLWYTNSVGDEVPAELWFNDAGTWKLAEIWQNQGGTWRVAA